MKYIQYYKLYENSLESIKDCFLNLEDEFNVQIESYDLSGHEIRSYPLKIEDYKINMFCLFLYDIMRIKYHHYPSIIDIKNFIKGDWSIQNLSSKIPKDIAQFIWEWMCKDLVVLKIGIHNQIVSIDPFSENQRNFGKNERFKIESSKSYKSSISRCETLHDLKFVISSTSTANNLNFSLLFERNKE